MLECPRISLNVLTSTPFSIHLVAKVCLKCRALHFRHAQALHYYQSGADLFQVQQRLRHRTITSTLIYVQLDAKLKERRHIENPFDAKHIS